MPDYGDGSPRENFGAVDPLAPSVANGQITPEQWADYQAKRKKDFILGLLGVLGATTGLGAVSGAMSGGAAAGSAGMGAIPGGAPWAVTPYAGTAASAGTGAAAVGGTVGAGAGLAGGAGTGAAVGAGMSAKDWIALAAGLGGTVGGALSKPTDLSPNTGTTDPQLKELLAMMTGRLKKQEPLQDSILSMANGLLPTKYQNGGGG